MDDLYTAIKEIKEMVDDSRKMCPEDAEYRAGLQDAITVLLVLLNDSRNDTHIAQ